MTDPVQAENLARGQASFSELNMLHDTLRARCVSLAGECAVRDVRIAQKDAVIAELTEKLKQFEGEQKQDPPK